MIKLDEFWTGGHGAGLRCLLNAANDAGARQWFNETVVSYDLEPEKMIIGDLARAMLTYKLDQLVKYQHMK